MPIYRASSASLPITHLGPGDTGLAWAAETPLVATASQAFGINPGGTPFGSSAQSVSVEVFFNAAPGTFSIQIQTADTDVDSAYQSEAFGGNTPGVINAATNNYARVELSPIKAKFIRLLMATAPSNASISTTAKISR